MSDGGMPVVLRIGMNGEVARVPFVTDERGGAGRLFREQIGCSWFDVIRLDQGLDMWVDDEAIVGVDFSDEAALSEALNVVATLVANRLGRPGPVFGAAVVAAVNGERSVALSADQLARVQSLAEMSVAALADGLTVRIGGVR